LVRTALGRTLGVALAWSKCEGQGARRNGADGQASYISGIATPEPSRLMSCRWDLDFTGFSHVVQLGSDDDGPPDDFDCDGVEQAFPGGRFHHGPRTATFGIAGHQASLTFRTIGLAPGWRTFGAEARLIGYVIYELIVDGDHRGSWVATIVQGALTDWTFVPPDEDLPDDFETWYPGSVLDSSLGYEPDRPSPVPEQPSQASADSAGTPGGGRDAVAVHSADSARRSDSQQGPSPRGWLAVAFGGWAIGVAGAGLTLALGSHVFTVPERLTVQVFAFSAVVSVLVATAIMGRIVGLRGVAAWVRALALVCLVNVLWGAFVPVLLLEIH